MSQALSGTYGNVKVGAVDLDVQGWSVDIEANTFDSTTTADQAWDDTTSTTKKLSGSCDLFYNLTKKPFGSLGMIPGVTLTTMVLYISLPDDEKLTGNALLTKMSLKSKSKEGLTITASFVNKGPWVLPS